MSVAESYTNDVFRIWYYKRILCARKEKHEWAACAFAHPGERANRRDPRCHGPALCHEQEKTGDCPMGDQCPNAHSVFEAWLHPRKYRTQMCSDAPHCTRNLCFFAHNADELRHNISIPPCPPEYDELMAKSAATTTSSGGRHGQHGSQGYQPGHRNIANSAAAGAVSGYCTHPSSTGSGHSAPPSPYYSGTGLQLPSSESASSTSIQQQNCRSRGGLAGGGAASPGAGTARHQQSVPGMYINTVPIQAAPVAPLPAPAGFNAAAAATYTPPYPVHAHAMAATAYAPSAGSMPPVRSSGVSNSGSTAADAAQPQPQPPQRQGTGVYVPVAAGFSGVGSSGNHGGYTAGTPHQQLQAAAAWFGSTRGRAFAGGSAGNTSRSSAGARERSMHSRQQQQQQRHELAKLGPQHSTQLLADKLIADEKGEIETIEEAKDAVYNAVTEQFQEPPGHTPSRQSSAAAAIAAATAALSVPTDSAGPSQQHTDEADHIHNSQPQLHIRLLSDEVLHQASNSMHDAAAAAAAALAAVTAAGGVESSETKLRNTREMLKAALSELSAMRARAQAAEARIAAADSYMTKAALQAYAAAEEAAKMHANEAAAAGKPDETEDATATDELGAVDAAVAQAGVSNDSMAATSDDAQNKETAAPGESAAPARVAAEGGEKASCIALQQDTTEAAAQAEAKVQGAGATVEDDVVKLSELMPVSCAVLADSRMLVALPKAMTPGDVGSLLRAAMARAGANELQVRTADVILHAQLVAMRESQAESRLMQTELDIACKAAQQAAGERDKFEVKYRSYKLASRQHLSEVTLLQQQVKKAQAQAEEACTTAANAWALVKQAQKPGAVNWADAMSESDGEGVDDQDQTEVAAAQSVPAN